MKLWYDKKSKDPAYFVQYGYRMGKKTTTKNIKKIGKHSELLAITDDPLTYAKEEVRKYNEAYQSGKVELSLEVDFDEKLTYTGDTVSKPNLLHVGYFLLQAIYQDLDLKDFFRTAQETRKMTYSCNDINRFLTYARILDPASKRGTFDRLDTYYEQPDFGYHQILRFMDLLEEHYDAYLEHLYEHSNQILKRDTSVCYFDCTNYYFETEGADTEYVDAVTGEIFKGLRQYGISKQHQPSPLVQMGLFMDGDGVPLSMCINPGSDNEQKCAVPLEKKLVKMFHGKPFIYCADAGLGSYNIRKFNDMGGRAFIVTQSIKKLSNPLQQAVFNDFDYRRLSDNAPATIAGMKTFDRSDEKNLALYNDRVYKVLYADHAVDTGLLEEKKLKNGKTQMVQSKANLKQRVIITFSRKMLEYQRHIRNRQIERAKLLLTTKKVEDVKKGPHDVTRFIQRTSTGKSGERARDHYQINQAAIAEEEKYDGYYAVATNLEDDVKSILDINGQRYKIEDCFRVLKTNFGARPAYHRNRPRIIAHFMICYTALLVFRLLQTKLDRSGEHFTTDQILQTLKNMQVVNFDDQIYQAAYRGSEVCTVLNGVLGLGLDRKYYRPKELNKKIKKIL